MSTFASDLLPDLDDIRGIADELGLRPFTVTVRVRTWSGSRPGVGTKTDVDTVLTVAGGTQHPKVKQISAHDVVASGGLYTTADWRIGPMTPPFVGGGVTYGTIDPATTTTAREVGYKIEGGMFPSGGAWFERISDENDSALHSFVVVRKSGRVW